MHRFAHKGLMESAMTLRLKMSPIAWRALLQAMAQLQGKAMSG
jgi:hypothetical protein